MADRAEVQIGERVTFSIGVRNVGLIPLSNVTVNIALNGAGVPVGVTVSEGLVSTSSSGVEWRLEALDVGAAAFLQVTVLVTNTGLDHTLAHCATASAAEAAAISGCVSVAVLEVEAGVEAGAEEEHPLRGEPFTARLPTPAPQAEAEATEIAPQAAYEVRLRGWECVHVLGVTVTCLPTVRWALLIGGLLLAGVMLWLLVRSRR